MISALEASALANSAALEIAGINVDTRDPDGGIITFDAPIHMSNVMLVDPASETASRVRTQVEEDGTKERIAVKTGNPIPRPQ